MSEESKRVWTCKIGWAGDELPLGSDLPMRDAVAAAYKKLTGGHHPDFIFSGWGGELTEPELAVVENREPSAEYEAQWHHDRAMKEHAADLLYEAWTIIANAHGGNWDEASDEWQAAAVRWRDRWHETLTAAAASVSEDGTQ